jgi:hypothetical protein
MSQHERDELLQRYFDGELSPDERAKVEASLTAEEQSKLAALAELGGLVRGALEAEAQAFDLWPGLEAALAREAVPTAATGGGGAAGAASSPAAGAASSPAAGAAGLLGGAVRRLRWWAAGTASTLAAGAALLFVLMPGATTNDCDIEELEVSGSTALVTKTGDSRDDATIIWTMELDDGEVEPDEPDEPAEETK